MAEGLNAPLGFKAAWQAECGHLRQARWDLAFVTVLPIAILVVMAWLLSAGGMLSLIHISEPTRQEASRMPSSA